MTSLKETQTFHQRKKRIPKVVLSKTEKHEIIHGAQASNKQLPRKLRRPTEDYDIFTKIPRKDARQTERALDREFGGDFFVVKRALHPGTYKVKSKHTGETYADYTKPRERVPRRKIGKHNYATLDYIKKHKRKTLKDPSAKFRHAKDRDELNRILLHEKAMKARKAKRKKAKPRGIAPRIPKFNF